jgi:hypothetical protein
MKSFTTLLLSLALGLALVAPTASAGPHQSVWSRAVCILTLSCSTRSEYQAVIMRRKSSPQSEAEVGAAVMPPIFIGPSSNARPCKHTRRSGKC